MLLTDPLFLTTAGLCLFGWYFWHCSSSHLRAIPGPRISLFTSWILKYHEFQARRTKCKYETQSTTVKDRPIRERRVRSS
ncbi:hypothetical protein F5Y18DRAFT_374724 [Xylariaceae sp. FL1019]|nr:hypothetical protein F5Y18DRAFT_374724 [Xylariaceae sp. FL1019]